MQCAKPRRRDATGRYIRRHVLHFWGGAEKSNFERSKPTQLSWLAQCVARCGPRLKSRHQEIFLLSKIPTFSTNFRLSVLTRGLRKCSGPPFKSASVCISCGQTSVARGRTPFRYPRSKRQQKRAKINMCGSSNLPLCSPRGMWPELNFLFILFGKKRFCRGVVCVAVVSPDTFCII